MLDGASVQRGLISELFLSEGGSIGGPLSKGDLFPSESFELQDSLIFSHLFYSFTYN